jgi:hypothetical protein
MSKKQRLSLLAILVLVALLFAGSWVYRRAAPLMAYAEEQRSITGILERIHRQPESTPMDRAWNDLVGQVQSGASNVFFSPRHASLDEAQKYRQEIQERFSDQKQVSLGDLKWAWDRLRQAGPTASGYIDKIGQPLFDEALEAVRRADQAAELPMQMGNSATVRQRS